jgi:predicted phage replisome organizer
MSDVKWIKVSTNMFDSSRKIKQIEMMPEGDTILVIWLKLLLLAGNINDGGQIYLTPEIPYTEEMLANELRRPLNTVRMALNLFVKFDMIEIVDDILKLSSWEKYQSIDKLADIRERNRLSQQRSRARRKALEAGDDMSGDSHVTGHGCHRLEEEREEDKEKEIHSFILAERANENNGFSTGLSTAVESRRTVLGGELGKGVVMLSEEQMNDLLEKLSLEEFNHYVSVVADCILKGKPYKRKTHYQAILDMATKDRKIK